MEEKKEALDQKDFLDPKVVIDDEEEEDSPSNDFWKALAHILNPKNQKVIGWIFWGLVTLGVAGFVGQGLYSLWEEELDPDEAYWSRDHVSDNVYVQQPYHGRTYVYNETTHRKTLRGVDDFVMPHDEDSLVLFFKKDRRGYFDRYTGRQVIAPVYERAWLFSEGVAFATLGDSLYLIDPQGRRLRATGYFDGVRRQKGIDYIYHDGVCVMNDAQGRVGLIDREGQWLLPPTYSYIDPIGTSSGILYRVMLGQRGEENRRYGVVDGKGQVVLPCRFTAVNYCDGYLFAHDSLHYQWRFSLDGTRHDEPLCYNVSRISYETDYVTDSEGYQHTVEAFAPLFTYTSSCDGYMGLMDARGHRLTPPVYRNIKALNADLYCCGYDYAYDHSVLLNAKGQVVE